MSGENGKEVEATKPPAISPLFRQIAAMMALCGAAKKFTEAKTETTTKEGIEEMRAMVKVIDFANGERIIEGAAQACEMSAPGVDLFSSGFMVGMPPRAQNPEKICFIKAELGPQKNVFLFIDKESGEKLIEGLTKCLDILHPNRIVGVKPPKLIV